MKTRKKNTRTKDISHGTKKLTAEGAGIEEMRSLISRMAPILRCAEYFAEGNDLRECPGCGLVEDMDVDGNILTYIDGGPMKDSGYRFTASGDRKWVCPICHTVGSEYGAC